ncbi:hypothetical protein BD309DRAFT_1072014 [Dichomitus squalens]|nr:hypothetical protein BD309DRAFT_1072014 [Dichomitus squalens]
MRILWLSLLFFVALMLQTCEGCGRDFKDLTRHRAKCAAAYDLLAGGIKRHLDEDDRRDTLRTTKKQRWEAKKKAELAERKGREAARRARLEAEWAESMPVFPEIASQRTGRVRRIPGAFRDMVPSTLRGLPSSLTLVMNPPPPMPAPPAIDPLPPPFDWPEDDHQDPTPDSPRPRPHAYVEDAPEEPEPYAGARDYPPHSMDLPPGAPRPPYFDTIPNEFGIFRRYTLVPQRDPEEGLTTADFADSATHLHPPINRQERNPLRAFGASITEGLMHARDVAAKTYAPFLNWSAFGLMTWQYSGSVTKSAGELQRLVDDVLLDPRFDQGDLVGFRASREKQRLDDYAGTAGAFAGGGGWREVEVELHVPKEHVAHESEPNTESFFVCGIWARNLTEVLKTAFQDVVACKYHWFPPRLLRRRSPNAPLERVYTEVYNSDAMLDEHEKLQKKPRNPEDDPNVEYVVAALTLYSDSTHVAQFDTAALWPIHVLFANLSKYFRLKPTMFPTHHLAYIPTLPAELFEWYKDLHGAPPSAAVIRLLKHDLMQKIWLHLLDAEFMHAFEHGILIKCGDGIVRRIFPRIFLYAADYPEKCLVACLKFLGKCACPECLIEKKDFDKMGTQTDLKHRVTKKREDTSLLHAAIAKAREWIFTLGRAPEGSNIKATLLNKVSITPTRSAFSIRFARFKQNCYDLFTPDLMHEFELGVWKSTFTHLI